MTFCCLWYYILIKHVWACTAPPERCILPERALYHAHLQNKKWDFYVSEECSKPKIPKRNLFCQLSSRWQRQWLAISRHLEMGWENKSIIQKRKLWASSRWPVNLEIEQQERANWRPEEGKMQHGALSACSPTQGSGNLIFKYDERFQTMHNKNHGIAENLMRN